MMHNPVKHTAAASTAPDTLQEEHIPMLSASNHVVLEIDHPPPQYSQADSQPLEPDVVASRPRRRFQPKPLHVRILWTAAIFLCILQNFGIVPTLFSTSTCSIRERDHQEVARLKRGAYWTDPAGDEHCGAFGVRYYRARLRSDDSVALEKDWLETCYLMPMTIHGRQLEKPDRCERRDDGQVWGIWRVDFGEPTCAPYWGTVTDLGCVSTGLARLQSRLLGIQHGDNWKNMCSTTPAKLLGVQYDHPTHCEDKGFVSGVIGMWDIERTECN
ncbi:uncharacterized protein BXZ73DRAFT_97333 [Epithele typhae]|uniref:uncharacterized protein n=1 Tax=Epithele typhae TaxID=378194 RepID=UPI002008D8DF|nr:uncharacterized protein BXZ73DRAFT_97333 [Epithele typhae]KAH9943283.1 hypothetical protein BXZ73DRAFT_97333 [Epithele typhae]